MARDWLTDFPVRGRLDLNIAAWTLALGFVLTVVSLGALAWLLSP